MPNDQQALKTKNLLQALPRSCWVPYEPEDQKAAQQRIIDEAKKMQAQQQSQQKAGG